MSSAFAGVAPTEFWDAAGRVADGVTLVAALLALLALHPIYSIWRTRPKIAVRITPFTTGSMEVQFFHDVGSASPARNFIVTWGVLDEANVSMLGDGHWWMEPGLAPYGAVRVEIIDGEPIGVTADYTDDWMKVRVGEDNGFIIDASWQRSIRSWLRERKVVLWTQSDRSNGLPPRELKRREAKRASDSVLRGQPVSRT